MPGTSNDPGNSSSLEGRKQAAHDSNFSAILAGTKAAGSTSSSAADLLLMLKVQPAQA